MRGKRDCQHHGSRELGCDGMANSCKPPINVVTCNKPKVLRGLNQKVCGVVQELSSLLAQTTHPPANKRSLPHHGLHAERGKPITLPTGQDAVRRLYGVAGKGGGSKRKPRRNDADRG